MDPVQCSKALVWGIALGLDTSAPGKASALPRVPKAAAQSEVQQKVGVTQKDGRDFLPKGWRTSFFLCFLFPITVTSLEKINTTPRKE